MKETKTNLLIIGAGPAGLGAALYARRSGIEFEIVDKNFAGGQIINTQIVENYLGFKDGISGFELIQNMIEHCKSFDINVREYFKIDSIRVVKGKKNKDKNPFLFVCFSDKNTIQTKTIILSTGSTLRSLGADGEERLIGKGISFCATCDAALYKDREVAVIGGGNTAIEEAIFLTRFVKKVYVIHRREKLRAVKILQDRAFKNEKISFILNSEVKKFIGDDKLKKIIIWDKKNNKTSSINIDGAFEYVGINPNSDIVKGLIKLDKNGFIITDSDMQSSVPGIFAAGDVRKTSLRQVITAVADGAIAATSVEKYLDNLT